MQDDTRVGLTPVNPPPAAAPSWGDLLKANFDKIILIMLFVLLLALGLVIRLQGKETSEWSLHTADLILGTLVGMLARTATEKLRQ